jgi:hypothetical protein
MQYTAKQLCQRFEDMKRDKNLMESLYRDIDRYVMDKDGIVQSVASNQGSRSSNIFTKAGVKYNTRFASALQGLIAPAEQRWFELVPDAVAFQELSPEAQLYLYQLENAIYDTFASTNFYQKSLELLTDYTAYGMAGMYVEPDPVSKIQCIAVPIRELFIQTDFKGNVNQVARHFYQTAEAIHDRFPKHTITQLRQLVQNQPFEKREVLHMVLPSNDKTYPFTSYYVYKDSQTILEQTPLRRNPYLTPRWTVYSGETYGRSQAMVAIPDLKALSDTIKNMLIGSQRLVRPAHILMSDSVMGRGVDLNPDAITVIDRTQARGVDEVLRPINTAARPDIALNIAQEWERKVAEIFMADLIAEDKAQRMSATEASTRHTLRMANLAPQHGRINPEYLDKLIQMVVMIHIEQGFVPVPPEEIKGLKIKYKNPLAKAQSMASVEPILQYVSHVAQFAQINPSVLDAIDLDKAVAELAIAYDVPPTILRSQEEVQAMRQQQAQAQQAQQMQQAGLAASEMMHKNAQVASLLAPQEAPSSV